ncbi:MAG: hypothetical protein NTX85_01900 [Candidatus Nomurabacteria bacterium]|nr:hypothetical protein [Candidatus Nomurabacteria bacterium]
MLLGRVYAQINISVARTVLATLKEKIAQGGLPTKPPIGYKTIGEKGHKIHVINNETAPLVKKMFELYSTGNFSVVCSKNCSCYT